MQNATLDGKLRKLRPYRREMTSGYWGTNNVVLNASNVQKLQSYLNEKGTNIKDFNLCSRT